MHVENSVPDATLSEAGATPMDVEESARDETAANLAVEQSTPATAGPSGPTSDNRPPAPPTPAEAEAKRPATDTWDLPIFPKRTADPSR